MQNKNETGSETNTNWTPPRGIRYFVAEGRPSPFGLSWREGGKPKFKFFDNEDTRELLARKLAEDRAEIGRAAMDFDPAEYSDAKRIAGGHDLRDVAREWLAGGRGIKKTDSIDVSKAVGLYLARRFASDVKRDTDTGRHLDLHLQRRFVEKLGTVRVDEITPDMLRAWLAGIVSEKTGEKLGTLAQRQHLKDLNVFFVRAIREGWAEKNPCDLVDLPKIPVKDVQILTVEQARKLLAANRGFPIAARLALEMFGGLRASSVERLKKEHVDFERKGIRLLGHVENEDGEMKLNHKSGKTKYRQGQPEVLWKWLAEAPETTWTKINEGNYGHEKVKAVARAFGADFTLPHNACRHSFASYHLAAFKDLAKTGYLMQHTNQHTTTIYEGVAREQDANEYFAIKP